MQGINFSVLDCFVQKLSRDSRLNTKNLKIDFERTYNPIYIYDIVDLTKCNSAEDTINRITTPMCSVSVWVSKFVAVSKVGLSKHCIQRNYLKRKKAFHWLYYFMRNTLCTSLINFKELFGNQFENLNQKFCQPRFLLYGQNLFNLYIKKIAYIQIQKLYLKKGGQ